MCSLDSKCKTCLNLATTDLERLLNISFWPSGPEGNYQATFLWVMRAFLHSGSLSIWQNNLLHHVQIKCLFSQNGKQQKHCCTLKQAVYVDLFWPDQLVLLLYIMLHCFLAWCYGLRAVTGHQVCLWIVSMLNSTITRFRDPPCYSHHLLCHPLLAGRCTWSTDIHTNKTLNLCEPLIKVENYVFLVSN